MELRLIVGGDVAGGWLVDVHDGDKNGVYRPEAANQMEAAHAALTEHAQATATPAPAAPAAPAATPAPAAPAAPAA